MVTLRRSGLRSLILPVVVAIFPATMRATPVKDWCLFRTPQRLHAPPRQTPPSVKRITVGSTWSHTDQFIWLVKDIAIPSHIDGARTHEKAVGLRFNAAGGGEIYIDGKLETRFDNDHPALAVLTEAARPGQVVRVAAQIWPSIEGGSGTFHQADLILIEARRLREPLPIRVHTRQRLGRLLYPFGGLSQGGGMADYEDATAAKLREAGFRWFRMDNVLTHVVKRRKDGGLIYDFADLDRRVDFIRKIGAEPILCLSYMPEPFDAVPNKDRHSAPKDYGQWEALVYRAAKRLVDRGTPVKYWEVWNEPNSGWLVPPEGQTGLEAYLKLYAASVRGVKRADPSAWIGGPANASGPWDRSNERPYCVNGRLFMRGLIEYCAKQGLPLDFISWHEYFHPPQVYLDEANQIRRFLDEFPSVKRRLKEFMITEWNYAWWHDYAQDHELGAAWAANTAIRAFIPARIDKPCFFYVKDNDERFHGSWAMLMRNNVPKAVFNVARMFNSMAPQRLKVVGGDEQVCALASIADDETRLTVIIVNFAQKYGIRRPIDLSIDPLPPKLRNGRWRRYLVDATHSNVWHDRAHAELEQVDQGRIPDTRFAKQFVLETNGVTMLELLSKDRPPHP